METIAWLGSAMLAVCGLPQAVKTIRTKSAKDLSALFLALWLGGEICLTVYTLVVLKSAPLLFNYVGNIVLLLPVVYYKTKEMCL